MKRILCLLAVLSLIGCQSVNKPKCSYHISHDASGLVTGWSLVKGDPAVCSRTSSKLDSSVKSGKFKVPTEGVASGKTFDVTP